MNELHTFVAEIETKKAKKKYQFTVKGDFLQKCENPEKHDIYHLMTVYKLGNFLHNPTGPAIVNLSNGLQEYWLDGKILNAEESAKIAHDYNFNNKLLDEVVNKE